MRLLGTQDGITLPSDLSGMVFGGFIQTAPSAPGDAAGHVYTVDINFPSGVRRFANVKNSLLPLDSSANTKPARVGDPVIAFLAGNKLNVLIWPQPDVAECQ